MLPHLAAPTWSAGTWTEDRGADQSSATWPINMTAGAMDNGVMHMSAKITMSVDRGPPLRGSSAIGDDGSVGVPSEPRIGDVPADAALPATGLHHVRIPVSDAWRSRDWYVTALGFVPVLDLEEENGVVGVVLRHPEGLVVGLHQDPSRAAALAGFAVLGLGVADKGQLEQWAQYLDRLGAAHGPLEEGHLGWYLDVPDPDGIVVRFHSGSAPDAEEA